MKLNLFAPRYYIGEICLTDNTLIKMGSQIMIPINPYTALICLHEGGSAFYSTKSGQLRKFLGREIQSLKYAITIFDGDEMLTQHFKHTFTDTKAFLGEHDFFCIFSETRLLGEYDSALCPAFKYIHNQPITQFED